MATRHQRQPLRLRSRRNGRPTPRLTLLKARTTRAALVAGRAYAGGAVDAAGKTLDQAKGHANRLADQTSRYVVEQPLRAVGIAAGAGFLFAVLLNGLRRR